MLVIKGCFIYREVFPIVYHFMLQMFNLSDYITFVASAWSFVFSSPPQRPVTSDFSIPDLIHYIYFPILILEIEPVFSLLNIQC